MDLVSYNNQGRDIIYYGTEKWFTGIPEKPNTDRFTGGAHTHAL